MEEEKEGGGGGKTVKFPVFLSRSPATTLLQATPSMHVPLPKLLGNIETSAWNKHLVKTHLQWLDDACEEEGSTDFQHDAQVLPFSPYLSDPYNPIFQESLTDTRLWSNRNAYHFSTPF